MMKEKIEILWQRKGVYILKVVFSVVSKLCHALLSPGSSTAEAIQRY